MELVNGYLIKQFEEEFSDFTKRLMELYKETSPNGFIDYNESNLPSNLFNLRLINNSQRESLDDFLEDAKEYILKGVYVEGRQNDLCSILKSLKGEIL